VSNCVSLKNLKRGGQGPIWAVEPFDGWMDGLIGEVSVDGRLKLKQVVTSTVVGSELNSPDSGYRYTAGNSEHGNKSIRPSVGLPRLRKGLFLWCELIYLPARFWVLTATNMKMRDFWYKAPCSVVGVSRRFRGAYSFHHECDE
jgi:hypothetical protein